MNARPEQPEPYVRGCLYPGLPDAPYPRAEPKDREHLPSDVWEAARVPAGVRLELTGEVSAVRINYRTATANLGYRGEGAGCKFSIYRSGQKIAEEEAVLGDGVAHLPMSGEPSRPAIVYLPEGMRPVVLSVEGIGGSIEPAPRQPRWLCFGDAVTQGWLASSPALAWPAVTARKLGLDLCNLGFSGSVRSDPGAAIGLADTSAELISISLGANSWGRFPHTPAMCMDELRAILALVREGHPDAPIVVVSPLLRPDAEDTPNRLGATLTELRIAMEETVRERMLAGDVRLHLVEGSTLVAPCDLDDGIYPGDEGHIRVAAAVGKVLSPLMTSLRASADKRWAAETAAAIQLELPQLPSTDFLRQVVTPQSQVVPGVVPPLPPLPGAPPSIMEPAKYLERAQDGYPELRPAQPAQLAQPAQAAQPEDRPATLPREVHSEHQ